MAKRILVVDDELSILRLVGTRLMASGYEVVGADNGADACEKAGRLRPDAVVLDIAMPDMDGGEVARRLAEDPATRDIPIVFLSALVRPLETSRNPRGPHFLAKPFRAKELLGLLQRILG
jgi:CheY-like chemotaxis protein